MHVENSGVPAGNKIVGRAREVEAGAQSAAFEGSSGRKVNADSGKKPSRSGAGIFWPSTFTLTTVASPAVL